MNKPLFYSLLATALTYTTHILPVTITATQFNALYSCANPFRPTETSTIILDTDIIINDTIGGCEPIVPGVGFNVATDVVNFTSTTQRSVQVTTSSLWYISLNLTFQGNAQLLMFPGAGLVLRDNNPTVCMSENSLFKPVS